VGYHLPSPEYVRKYPDPAAGWWSGFLDGGGVWHNGHREELERLGYIVVPLYFGPPPVTPGGDIAAGASGWTSARDAYKLARDEGFNTQAGRSSTIVLDIESYLDQATNPMPNLAQYVKNWALYFSSPKTPWDSAPDSIATKRTVTG
jgi:hypothetical protein